MEDQNKTTESGRTSPADLDRSLGRLDEDEITRLVDLGLLDRTDDGWDVHGYLELQNSKADVEKSKEDARQRKARSRRKAATDDTETTSQVTDADVTSDSRVTFNQNQNQNSLTPIVVRECAPANETKSERRERELIDTWAPTEAHRGVAGELAAQGRPRVDLDELATTFRLKLHAKGLKHYGYKPTLDGLDNAFFEWIRSESRQLAEGRPAHSGKPAPEAKPHTHTWACEHVLALLDRTPDTATPDDAACMLAAQLNDGLDPGKAIQALIDAGVVDLDGSVA